MEIIESSVPPGFRFHPTEEELVGYYLKRKINDQKIDLDVIIDIDLYKMEPWDIQGSCRGGDYEEQNEWYFFSHKDRKYPTGTRTNRATSAGFWKATGRDKAVVSKNRVIGMRKTLVFYKGRAPNGSKTDWIMHEYRLQTSELGPPQEEGWVVCRAFKKPSPNQNQGIGPWNNHHHHQYHNPCYFKNNNNNQYSNSENIMVNSDQISSFHPNYFGSNQQQDFMVNNSNTCLDINQFIELPNLESPTDETKDFEWNLLDNLLSSSQISQTTSSTCDQLNSQNQYCGFGNFVDL